MKTIILAAGKGSRLGEADVPKPLTKLANGKSILELQLDHLKGTVSLNEVIAIVGFHKEQIMENFPDLLYVYNPDYEKENTAKSLLRALKKIHNEDVLWLNGDVVFHPSIPAKLISFERSCMLVNEGSVGEEEVKYRLDQTGKIAEVSKTVESPLGEALGINFIRSEDLPFFQSSLEKCSNRDYFEKGIEEAITSGLNIWPVPVSSMQCTEIDFPEDLIKANQLIVKW